MKTHRLVALTILAFTVLLVGRGLAQRTTNWINVNGPATQIGVPIVGANLATCSPSNPAILSGFSTIGGVTNATITQGINGSCGFQVNVNTNTDGSGNGALTLPTATHGWVCTVQDITTPGTYVVAQVGTTTTSASFTNYLRVTGAGNGFATNERLLMTCSPW